MGLPEQPAPPWNLFHENPDFVRLSKKKRNTTFALFFITLFFFFSIPFISYLFPAAFTWKMGGNINLGLSYVIAQYAIGGIIAWTYLRALRRIDTETKQLVERIWPDYEDIS